MGFAQYLQRFIQKEEKIFEATGAENTIDLEKIETEITTKIGGKKEEEKSKKTSFEAIKQVLDAISLNRLETIDLSLEKSLSLLFSKDRFEFVEEYVKIQAKSAKDKIFALEGLDAIQKPIEFNNILAQYLTISERLLKLHKIFSIDFKTSVSEAIEVSPQVREKISSSFNLVDTAIKECGEKFNKNTLDEIKKTSANSDDEEIKFYKYKDFLENIGLAGFFAKALENKEEEIKKKELLKKNSSSSKTDVALKKKKRLLARLIDSIKLGVPPAIVNNQVTSNGDNYKLFKSLEKKQRAWTDRVLKVYVFNNDDTEYKEFEIGAREKESPLEKDQLTYLRANSSWIEEYINSPITFITGKDEEPVDAEFSDKDSAALKSALSSAVTEKEKEIKNYYLSKDFNLGNFASVQIKPEIKLPLHKKVKLAITDEDRKKESALRAIFTGLGGIVTGLLSALPDESNVAVATAARNRNISILKGMNSIIKGGVSIIGGKQKAREYDELITKRLPGENKIKEDMLTMTDAPGAIVINPEAPGQALQTPSSLSGNNMDTFSLAGPLRISKGGAKKNKKSKSKTKIKPKNKVSSFSDFMQRR